MSDEATEWQPQEPPVGLGFARSSSLGWRHNIPAGRRLCRKRAGSDGVNPPARSSTTTMTDSRQAGSGGLPNSTVLNEQQDEVKLLVPRDGLRQNPVTPPQLSPRPPHQLPRSISLKESRAGSARSTTGPTSGPSRPARPSAKRSKTRDTVDMPVSVPRVPDIPAAILLANRATKVETEPRTGPNNGQQQRQLQGLPTRPGDLTRSGQREALSYAAAVTRAHHLSVIPEDSRKKETSLSTTSVSAATSPLSIITTFKLRTPADSPEAPSSPSPWDTTGPHERFIDGIEFEMLEAPATHPPAPLRSAGSPIVNSSASILLAVQPRTTTASPDSSAPPMLPSNMLADITAGGLLAPGVAGVSSRASSVLLPDSMMPDIGRRLSEASTGSRTTIIINGAKIVIPRMPPPPPPKTPGPAMALTPDLSGRASRRLTRAKSYSALPPSCPKGTLPRPVSKYNPAVGVDFSSMAEAAPPVPTIPSSSHTPSSSISSISSSSSATMVKSTPNKISLAASGTSPRERTVSPPTRPGPPPARPPPPPPLRLSGLGISDIPVTESPWKESNASRTAPVTRTSSISKSLKRQSSGTDKDGRKPTDVVKKVDSGIKKKDAGGLSRSKSELRRDMVKKMALDNIGAVKIREASPKKAKKAIKEEAETSRPVTRPLIRPPPEDTKLQSRKSMLRIQADEQDKINTLGAELRALEAQCSEAKRHHEALHVARSRLFDDFPDDDKSISSVYVDDQSTSSGSGPMSPGKEEALADIDDKIHKWKTEMQQNEHKRKRIQKKLAWHSTDRLTVVPLPVRRTPSPQRYRVKTPRVVTPVTAKSSLSDYDVNSAELKAIPTLPTPKSSSPPQKVPETMPELDDGRRPSIDSTSSLMTPPASPLTRSNEPWIGLESPFTPFLDTPTRTDSEVNALNVRHSSSRNTMRSFADSLRSPEPRTDRQMTIQVFAESGITDLVASLQQEIDHLSRRVRI